MRTTIATAAIKLRVEDVDGSEDALLTHGHGFVVQSCLAPRPLQVSLAHVGLAALHEVRLDRRDVVQFLQLDAVVDDGSEEWIALRVVHRHVVLAGCP